jgi:hypothetical protein
MPFLFYESKTDGKAISGTCARKMGNGWRSGGRKYFDITMEVAVEQNDGDADISNLNYDHIAFPKDFTV